MEIKKFAIFSERNSGSNYLQQLLEVNFGLESTCEFGFKHWWIPGLPDRPSMNTTTDREVQRHFKDQSDDVLFIILTRNPVEWLRSMFVRPHHLRADLHKKDFEEFLETEWVCEGPDKLNELWDPRQAQNESQIRDPAVRQHASSRDPRPVEDRRTFGPAHMDVRPDPDENGYFIERAQNVVDIRNQKYRHWLHLLSPEGPKHVEFVNYENLPDYLEVLAKKYELSFLKSRCVNVRKPDHLQKSTELKPEIDDELRTRVLARLDLEFEKRLGYHLVLDRDHEVMSVMGKRDFEKFVIIADHICLHDWQLRLRDVLLNFHDTVETQTEYPAETNDNPWDESVLYFFFNMHARPHLKKFPTYFVLIQSEVYPTPYFERLSLRNALLFAHETWDYSAANTRRLRHDLGRSNYWHVPFPARGRNYDGHEKRDIDVLFVGTLGPWANRPDVGTRRRPILNPVMDHFRQQGREVRVIERGVFGEEMEAILRRTKVLINIHYYFDVQPLEQPRVIPALECGVTVVSEPVPPEDCEMLQCNNLIYCHRDKFVETIEDVLNRYESPDLHSLHIIQKPTSLEVIRRLRETSSYGRDDLPLVALHMIVRNESKTLRHNLPRLVDIYDYFIFVDTGSTDDTISYILEFFQDLPENKHGIVVQRKWIHEFDQSRNESLRLCRGRTRFAMTLDADDVLQFPSAENIRQLLAQCPADFYRISMKEHRGGLFYNRCAAVSATKPFLFRYKLHECVGPTFKNARLGICPREIMYIERGILHGCRSKDRNTLSNDIRILKRCYQTESEEDRTRYCFYLAQTYFDIQNWTKAHKYYLLRSTMGSYLEEVYVSLWKAAVCLQHLRKPQYTVVRLLNQAVDIHSQRIETLWKIAEIYRKDRKFQQGYEWGRKGLEKPWKNSFEFGIRDVYRFRLVDEVSVCASYIGEVSQGKLLMMGVLRALPLEEMPEGDAKRIGANYEAMKNTRPTLAVYTGYSTFFKKDTKHFGGSEIALLEVLPLLQKDGFQVFVFCMDAPEDRKNNAFTQHGIQVFGIDEFQMVVEKQHKKRFDAVIVHRFIHYFLMAKPSWAVTTYVWLHDNCFHPYWNGHSLPHGGNHLMERLADQVHSVVTSSRWHKEMIAKQCPGIASKLRVVHLGLDLSLFPERLDLSRKEKWRFIWISDPSRGFEDFYRIFFWFKNNVYSRATLHIYGNAQERHLPAEYARDRNRLKDVVFHGYCKDRRVLTNALLDADVFLYPLSLGNISHETFCMSIVEAMAAGLLVVCPARAALSELVTNDRGRLLRPRAVEEDYYGVLEKLHEDYDQLDTLRDRAVTFARHFSFAKCAEHWFRLLTRSTHLYNRQD
jgi:glycosyltransferase involved in cell wall biosynthesis